MWPAESTEINNDQNSTAKNTTFRRHISDLLGGVRAKPLFRDSTTILAWNDKTETTTIVKQLWGAISSFTANQRAYVPVSFVRENVIGHVTQMILITQSITQAFVLCVPPYHAMLTNICPVHHTRPEKFENAFSFLRLGLPSTLLRHENSALRKPWFFKPEEIETALRWLCVLV